MLETQLRRNSLQLEEVVRARTQELEDAVQVRTSFLAIMSHGMLMVLKKWQTKKAT